MLFRGDLHVHTNVSDGALSPIEVVKLANSNNVKLIAITDHNSVDGIKRASEAGLHFGVSIVPGIELTTRINGEHIHLLGYFKTDQYESAIFKMLLRMVKEHRAFDARSLLGLKNSRLEKSSYLSVEEGLKLLRCYGASVVLAHPMLISSKHLAKLLVLPFDGIEARYGRSCEALVNKFIDEAEKRFKFYTGGSDFHTDKIKDLKHCLIGDTQLNSIEIQSFLNSSGALVLGSKLNKS